MTAKTKTQNIIGIVAHAKSSLKDSHLNILRQCDSILAADGGAEHLKDNNLRPSMILGDLDEISPATLDFFRPHSEIYRFRHDKDETDFELALKEALYRNASEIHIFCWADERIDYSWSTLLACRNIAVPVTLYMESGVVKILNSSNTILKISHPSKLSVYPLETHTRLKSIGLRWELDWIKSNTSTASQSNETLAPAIVKIKKGSAFCVLSA